ncbi:MAG: hypothetical protein WAO28_01835 [Candidatus Microsaccharimonas sp.]
MTDIPKVNEQSAEKLKEIVDDNARKFTLETMDPRVFDTSSVSTFLMTTHWLETGEDNERKIVHKKFDSGEVQILLISKITKDGKRTSEKEVISEEKYAELLGASVRHLVKMRSEFKYIQDDVTFDVKYDEFSDSSLRVLEVDASNEEARNSFDPSKFPSELSEVTGDMRYYGYRVAGII